MIGFISGALVGLVIGVVIMGVASASSYDKGFKDGIDIRLGMGIEQGYSDIEISGC